MDNLDEAKFYIKIKCSICYGLMYNRNGGSCPYCDVNGTTYIEASINEIKNKFKTFSQEDKQEIIDFLK